MPATSIHSPISRPEISLGVLTFTSRQAKVNYVLKYNSLHGLETQVCSTVAQIAYIRLHLIHFDYTTRRVTLDEQASRTCICLEFETSVSLEATIYTEHAVRHTLDSEALAELTSVGQLGHTLASDHLRLPSTAHTLPPSDAPSGTSEAPDTEHETSQTTDSHGGHQYHTSRDSAEEHAVTYTLPYYYESEGEHAW